MGRRPAGKTPNPSPQTFVNKNQTNVHRELVSGTFLNSSLLPAHLGKHNQWTFLALHNTTPYHNSNGRLLKRWNNAVLIELLLCSPCYPDSASIISKVHITLI